MRSRITSENTTFHKTATVGKLIRLELSQTNFETEVVLRFRDGATPLFDPLYDAKFKYNSDPSAVAFAFLDNDEQPMIIHSVPDTTFDAIHPMHFSSGTSSAFTIKLTEMANVDSNSRVLLHDTKLSIYHDLMASDYNFHADVNDDRVDSLFKHIVQQLLSTPLMILITLR